MPSRKHYPKELGKRLTELGQYEFNCRGDLCTIAWKDHKPIHFLSNYHEPSRATKENRRVWDRLAHLTTILHKHSAHRYPDFASCCRYLGAVDKNDQIACLNKTRRHYYWPCKLFMKFLVWAVYNVYLIMDSYRPHSNAGIRFCTFHMFVDKLCLQLIGDYRTSVIKTTINHGILSAALEGQL